jgi:hypothetical protein
VTFVVTQNLVSIVFASSTASRGASLKTLDALELAACIFWLRGPVWGSQGWRSHRVAARSVLYGLKQALHNRSAFWDRHSLHQNASQTKTF